MSRPTEHGEILAEELKATNTQNWTAYNKAQCEEKDRFLPMLADLCGTVPQSPQCRGRPRLPMSDMAFAAMSKVYGGMISPGFMRRLNRHGPWRRPCLGASRSDGSDGRVVCRLPPLGYAVEAVTAVVRFTGRLVGRGAG